MNKYFLEVDCENGDLIVGEFSLKDIAFRTARKMLSKDNVLAVGIFDDCHNPIPVAEWLF